MALPAKTVLCNASRLSGQRERITIQHESVPFCKRFQVRAGRRKGRPPQDRRRPLLRAGGPGYERDVPCKPAHLSGLSARHLSGVHRLSDEQPARHGAQRRRGRHPGRSGAGGHVRHRPARSARRGRLLVDHLPQGFQAELQSQHPAGRALLRRGHGADLPRVLLLQPALPRHQRRRRHVGGHGAQPRHLPHAVLLHVAPGGPAGPAFSARRSRTASTA